jgi:hypothetical protein
MSEDRPAHVETALGSLGGELDHLRAALRKSSSARCGWRAAVARHPTARLRQEPTRGRQAGSPGRQSSSATNATISVTGSSVATTRRAVITQINGLGLNLAAKLPLCRDCRWCRPARWMMVVPIFSLIPCGRWAAWKGASCRHSSSRYQPRRRGRDSSIVIRRTWTTTLWPEARHWQSRRTSARVGMTASPFSGIPSPSISQRLLGR